MKKHKFFTTFEEEENWLNDMAKQGYQFIKKKSFGYEFVSAPPENETIRIDYRSFNKQEDFEDYCALFEDSGWKHIAGTKSSGYQYFKRASHPGGEDIFSDVGSKAGRYKRLADMWFMLAVCFLPILAALLITNMIDYGQFLEPKSLYLTDGLWALDGAAFWRAFLFETPFVLFRSVTAIIFPASIFLYLYFAFRANKKYKNSQEHKII